MQRSISMIGGLTGLILFGLGTPAGAADRPATVEIVVPSSIIQAIEGIDIGPDGMIYGTSIHALHVYRIDPETGYVTVAVQSPYGESDDVAVGPAGTPAEGILAWTAQHTGEIRIQRPGGMPEVILPNAPRVNPIAFNAEGRLFTAQSGAGDNTLWELDVIGKKPPRVVAKGKQRLNGFGFGPDGRLYAPHFGSEGILAIDVDTGEHEVITYGVGTIAAVKVGPEGYLWSVDYQTGDLYRTDLETREPEIITKFPQPIDNLTISDDGVIYLAALSTSGILAYDPKTDERWTVTEGSFTVPLGMTPTIYDGREVILIADPFGYRFLDPVTYEIIREPEMWNNGGSSAVAASDDLIVTTYANFGRIRTIDRKTNTVTMISRALEEPRGVVLTSGGDIYVADSKDGRIVRVVGEEVETVADGLTEPVGLILENDTSALVTDIGTGSIRRVNLTSGTSEVVNDGLIDPRGLAMLPDGRVAVLETAHGTVTAIDLASGARTELARGLPISIDHHDLPDNTPLGIAVDSRGDIFVSCGRDNSIVKISLARD